ncbi:MAG TPA: SOS response-associated peptidase [Anaerolineales bacterium]
MTVEPGELREAFPGVEIPGEITARYNIAPSQPVAVIPNDGRNKLDFFVWGLIPSWAKDPAIGNRMINARAETLAEKPSFRAAYRRRRCLVLADGFYEWRKEPGNKAKTPMYIQMESKEPFAFAGLWEIWHSADGSEVRSCNIITTEPNGLVKQIHNRMPVILPREAYELWLAPEEKDPSELDGLLVPFPAPEMMAYPVSKTVNSPANDGPELVQPIAI